MIDDYTLSKEDIIKNKPLYEALNIMHHRHKMNNDRILYIDSKKGEMIPFFGLNQKTTIDYIHLTTDFEIIKNNPLFKNIRTVSYFNSNDFVPKKNTYDIFITDQLTAMKKYSDHVALNGYMFLLTNNDFVITPDFIQVYNNQELGFKCFKKIESFHEIEDDNAFSSCKPIKNKYELDAENKSLDVNLIINMISERQVQVVIIRFDDENKFDDEIKIIIHAVNKSSFEQITLKMNDSSVHKSIHDMTNIVIQEDERFNEKQLIPKIICQTLDENVVGEIHMRTIHNLKAMNPEYVYVFFDSRKRRQFIKEHFDTTVLDTYDGFVSGAFKADIFRYCWLYVNGGIYVDCKMINRISFRNFIQAEQEFVLCKDRIPNAMINGLIGITPKNPHMKNCILECVERFEKKIHNKVSFGSLYHTGPYMFYSCMSNYQTCCRFDVPFHDQDYKKAKIALNDDRVIFNVWFKDYYESYRKIHKKPIWSEQWAKGEIYYGKKHAVKNIDNLNIMVYPNQMDNTRDINFTYDKTVNLIMNDFQNNLRCKLIDDVNDVEKMVIINKNITNN